MENFVQKNLEVYSPHTDLWLVRHGQTDWNRAGRWQGQSPAAPALNRTGHAQALALRGQLKPGCVAAVYASDLLRSRQTAELLAEPLGLTVTLEPRLREMDLGDWEGMHYTDIDAGFSHVLARRERDPIHTRAPQGESPMDVARRVLPAVDEIAVRHCGESVLVVAHGITLAVILCVAQRIPLQHLYEHIPLNATLLQIPWKPPRYAGELIRQIYSVV